MGYAERQQDRSIGGLANGGGKRPDGDRSWWCWWMLLLLQLLWTAEAAAARATSITELQQAA